MNNIPRQKLQDILTQESHTVCDDPNQCESKLRELCPEYPREVNVLISALTQNVAADLMALSEATSKDVLLSKLARRLYDNFGMDLEFAQWAVESWALALGVITTAMFTTSDKTAKLAHSKITPADREWWNRLDYDWKGFFKRTFDIQGKPNDAQLATLVNLQELSCNQAKISRLEPLRHLTHLQVLNCSHNEIVSLGPLQDLTNLRILDCAFNNISRLEALQHLTNLQNLACYYTKISSLEPLQHLTQLRTLSCGNTQISNLEPLRELTDLQELDIRENSITELEPLSNLKKLRLLNANSTEISHLGPLHELNHLHTLYWDATQVSLEELEKFTEAGPQCDVIPALTSERKWWLQLDEEWQAIFKSAISISREPNNSELVDIVNLQKLNCRGTQISSLEPLHKLTNLRRLDCRGTQISRLEPLRELTNLRRLDCRGTQISRLEPLRELTELRLLDCRGTQISRLEPLYNLNHLHSLYWEMTQVSLEEIENFITKCPQCDVGVGLKKWWRQLDYKWKAIFEDAIDICSEPDNRELAKIVQLQKLDCRNRKITSLKPLRKLTNLQALNCYKTKISSLEPLRELTNLRKLNCRDNQINNLEPLHNLKNLQELDCRDTILNRREIKKFKKAVPQCEVKNDFWFS
jgi:Leucine-rich repeat (LRR) protein